MVLWGKRNFPIQLASLTGIRHGTLENVIEKNILVDTGILSNNIEFPFHACQMTFWSLIIYNDTLLGQDFQPKHDLFTELYIITYFQ